MMYGQVIGQDNVIDVRSEGYHGPGGRGGVQGGLGVPAGHGTLAFAGPITEEARSRASVASRRSNTDMKGENLVKFSPNKALQK